MLADDKVSEGAKVTIRKVIEGAPHADKFLNTALNDLESERPYYGMGAAGRIPFFKIVEYGKHYNLEGACLEDFIRDIQRVDAHITDVIIPKKTKRDARPT